MNDNKGNTVKIIGIQNDLIDLHERIVYLEDKLHAISLALSNEYGLEYDYRAVMDKAELATNERLQQEAYVRSKLDD